MNSIVAKQLGDSGGVVADYNDSYDNKPNVEERVTGTKFWNRHLVHCRSRSQSRLSHAMKMLRKELDSR